MMVVWKFCGRGLPIRMLFFLAEAGVGHKYWPVFCPFSYVMPAFYVGSSRWLQEALSLFGLFFIVYPLLFTAGDSEVWHACLALGCV
jgi:hypothetical protein